MVKEGQTSARLRESISFQQCSRGVASDGDLERWLGGFRRGKVTTGVQWSKDGATKGAQRRGLGILSQTQIGIRQERKRVRASTRVWLGMVAIASSD